MGRIGQGLEGLPRHFGVLSGCVRPILPLVSNDIAAAASGAANAVWTVKRVTFGSGFAHVGEILEAMPAWSAGCAGAATAGAGTGGAIVGLVVTISKF